jgi:ribosomal protein S18 acetylase RimI-like enzyme
MDKVCSVVKSGSPRNIAICTMTSADGDFVRSELIRNWHSTTIWSIDYEYRADELPGFVAWLDGERVGHITIADRGGQSEVVTLSATIEQRGVGSALLEAAVQAASEKRHRRIFLTTSNDNLRALALYQKRGWRLVAVHRGMMDRYRQRKKQIPAIGLNGIPLHDEIELELILRGDA